MKIGKWQDLPLSMSEGRHFGTFLDFHMRYFQRAHSWQIISALQHASQEGTSIKGHFHTYNDFSRILYQQYAKEHPVKNRL